jgi:CTP synthase (UTP-ammonia lyase)
MVTALEIGIIGDWAPQLPYHRATNAALYLAGSAHAAQVECTWVRTESLEDPGAEATLARFDGLWCAPGSPYRSMEGALRGIRYARETGVPFVGT